MAESTKSEMYTNYRPTDRSSFNLLRFLLPPSAASTSSPLAPSVAGVGDSFAGSASRGRDEARYGHPGEAYADRNEFVGGVNPPSTTPSSVGGFVGTPSGPLPPAIIRINALLTPPSPSTVELITIIRLPILENDASASFSRKLLPPASIIEGKEFPPRASPSRSPAPPVRGGGGEKISCSRRSRYSLQAGAVRSIDSIRSDCSAAEFARESAVLGCVVVRPDPTSRASVPGVDEGATRAG